MFSLTLLGDAFLSIALTSRADKWGRRKTLVLSSFFSVFTAVVFASQSNFWILLIAAVVGVISPSGNEIGPFLAVELSGDVLNSNLLSTHNILAVLFNLLFKRVLLFLITFLSHCSHHTNLILVPFAALSQITSPEDRTHLMAWYNLIGRFSSALGAFFCGGVVAYLSGKVGMSILLADRIVMILYSCVMVRLDQENHYHSFILSPEQINCHILEPSNPFLQKMHMIFKYKKMFLTDVNLILFSLLF